MLKPIAKNFKDFRFFGKGLAMVLGHLEQEIMEALWKKGKATGKEVFVELKSAREIALTTVLTVLQRLVKKGLVIKTKGADNIYIFTACSTKDEFSNEVSEEVLKGVIDLSASSAIAQFVDILAKKDPEELERLASIVLKKKTEREKRN
ncbi:MAG: BlaI/MecI/CopY family transcriptional regulator [Deltaproteobacteria bacterium]|nr:BlaI/MecI/CopY family transcriptional regulator [Deltaproteobacteria bacterium]